MHKKSNGGHVYTFDNSVMQVLCLHFRSKKDMFHYYFNHVNQNTNLQNVGNINYGLSDNRKMFASMAKTMMGNFEDDDFIYHYGDKISDPLANPLSKLTKIEI